MSQVNLALRFLLEMTAIAAVAYWGYHVTDGGIRWILAIGTPIALVVLWALVVAPGAENPVPQDLRVLIGSALLLLSAGLLFAARQPTLAIVLAVLVVANTVLMFVFRD